MLKMFYCDVENMSDAEFQRLYYKSDERRKAKVDRLRKRPAKKLSVAAGDLLRKAIAEEFNINASELRFRSGKNGKPYVENAKVEFSISHSENIAVCVLSDKPVGIDIEYIRDVNVNVARRLFTQDEQNYVFEKWPLVKQRFFEVWTRKEAYVKMLGKGVPYFPEFSTMGKPGIQTHIREKYIVSVAVKE